MSLKKLYENWIKKQYRKIRRKEVFVITYGEINVKKGKRKYTLIIFETAKQKVKINIGRHKTPDEIEQLLLT